MTLQTIFEQNKERFLSAVSGADAASAIRVMTAELDRALYTFADQEENDRVREAAGSMIQAAKAACTLVDSTGETKIYGRTEYGKDASGKKKVSKWGILLLVLGILGTAAAAAGLLLMASSLAAAADRQAAMLPPRGILAAVPLFAAVVSFFAGMLLRRRKAAPKETLHAETSIDASKVYNRLLSVILVIDSCLEDIRSSVRLEEKERQASAADPAELELLSQLLEDAYSRRGEDGQAEEEISHIRFYLHRKNIDVVDWSGDSLLPSGPEGAKPEGSSGWFDMMPAFTGGTIRPALAADGVLLKKGMASAGRG